MWTKTMLAVGLGNKLHTLGPPSSSNFQSWIWWMWSWEPASQWYIRYLILQHKNVFVFQQIITLWIVSTSGLKSTTYRRRRKVSHPMGNINKFMGECKCVSFREIFHLTTSLQVCKVCLLSLTTMGSCLRIVSIIMIIDSYQWIVGFMSV